MLLGRVQQCLSQKRRNKGSVERDSANVIESFVSCSCRRSVHPIPYDVRLELMQYGIREGVWQRQGWRITRSVNLQSNCCTFACEISINMN